MPISMVSIIVPVYNDEKRIALLINSLLAQEYPRDLFEVIIVDNGSTDRTREIVKTFPITLLEENAVQSSYAARNRGIRSARGAILAFIDSDCIAEPEWIKEGVAALNENKADLAGGKVSFMFSEKKSAAEYYDSLISMQNGINIRDRKASTTANVFVKARLFKDLGMFPEVKSGGDLQWTGNATQKGRTIVYAPRAAVRHPTRNLSELLKKQLRTGGGKPYIWVSKGEPLWNWRLIYILVRPPSPAYIRGLIRERGSAQMDKKFWGMWGVCYLCQFYFLAGIFSSIITIKRVKKTA